MGHELVEHTRQLLGLLRADGVLARALGGVGVALRCPSALAPPLAREYHDLDLATDRSNAHKLSEALARHGYAPAERFNMLHGHSRMMFTGPDAIHVDVLVDEFVMCHKLRLRDRLTLHHETLGLADLLLTKLQIAQINHKDVVDIAALLCDQPLSDDESGINTVYISRLLSEDWGWWRTVTANLAVVEELLPTLDLAPDPMLTITRRSVELKDTIGSGRRSMRWKARAKIGERVPWRFDPEESAT